jgi:hypothetical protein
MRLVQKLGQVTTGEEESREVQVGVVRLVGLALHFAYYNFVRIHRALRVPLVMAVGVTDHPWEQESFSMAIITKNGVRGKICSTCRKWKPLIDFSTDPTKGPSQGGRHCRCRACHREKQRERRRSSN